MVNNMTSQEFKDKIFDYSGNAEWSYSGTKPVVIDFYADWCRPCKMMAPILDEIAEAFEGKLEVYKINVDTDPEVAGVAGVQSVPTFLFVPPGEKPRRSVGGMPREEFYKMIKEVLKVE